MRPNCLVEQEHDQAARENRHGEQAQDRGDEQRPNRQRHPRPQHPGSTHVDHGGDVVRGAQNRGKTQQHKAHYPHLLAHRHPAVLRHPAERRIRGPAGARRTSLHREARQGDQARRHRNPEGEHVQARERHVRGADLEGDQVVREHTHQQQHDREEHHERPVHGDERDVELGKHDPVGRHGLGEQPAEGHGPAGPRELPAHQHRQQSTHQQEEEAQEEELDPDDLVVRGEDVLSDEGHLVMFLDDGDPRRLGYDRRHITLRLSLVSSRPPYIPPAECSCLASCPSSTSLPPEPAVAATAVGWPGSVRTAICSSSHAS